MKDAFILRLPPEAKERLTGIAKKIGIPLHALILSILWEYAEGRKING